MFRDLIPRLADRYHVIAPDHLGFGLSAAPSVAEFDYSFDALTDLTEGLLEQLGLTRYAIYVQDYGAPIGWRLALAAPGGHHRHRHPERQRLRRRVRRELLDDGVGLPARAESGHRGRRPHRARTSRRIKWQYLTGVADETLVSPDAWTHDAALVARPGNDEIQLALFRDYATNAPLYPALHDYLRTSKVPVLAVWGQGDPIFGPDGARAFGKDAPDAEIHLLDGGHFLLETAVDEVAELIRDFPATGRRSLNSTMAGSKVRRGRNDNGIGMAARPLGVGSVGHFLTAQPLPDRLLFVEPLRRRMRVRRATSGSPIARTCSCCTNRAVIPSRTSPSTTSATASSSPRTA